MSLPHGHKPRLRCCLVAHHSPFFPRRLRDQFLIERGLVARSRTQRLRKLQSLRILESPLGAPSLRYINDFSTGLPHTTAVDRAWLSGEGHHSAFFFAFAQRAAIAFLATSERCSCVIFDMRAFAPRRPSATAAGFFLFAIQYHTKRSDW